MVIRGKWTAPCAEVFSLRGGLWFGTYHLLNYPANYSVPLYRFADFNAGWYASRNAAFQNAVVKATGVKLALDGDLIRYDSDEPGTTELAVRRLAGQLGMSDSDIHRQLKKGDSLAFEESDLYKKIFKIAEKKAGKTLPREMLRINWKARKSPAISPPRGLLSGSTIAAPAVWRVVNGYGTSAG